MSIAHRLLANTINNFPDRADDILSEYFSNGKNNGIEVFHKAWNKALVYDQAFINQNQAQKSSDASNQYRKGKPAIIQNEDIFADNFIKFVCEFSDEIRPNINSLEDMLKDINTFGKETNEIYIVKELTSKLMKSKEIARHLQSLDDIIYNDMLQKTHRSESSFKKYDLVYDYSYLYLFRDSVAHSQLIFESANSHHSHYHNNSPLSTGDYKPVWLSRYSTHKPKLIDVTHGKLNPQHSQVESTNNINVSENQTNSKPLIGVTYHPSTKQSPADSTATTSTTQQKRYRQEIQPYGNVIVYNVPSNLIAFMAKAWCTYRVLTDAVGLGYYNIFPLAYKTEGCVQLPSHSRLKKKSPDNFDHYNNMDPKQQSIQLQKPSIKFIIELPSETKKFNSLNFLLLSSFLVNQPVILANWCAQLFAMTEFLKNKLQSNIQFSENMLSPLLDNVYVRPDGRLLLGNTEFSEKPLLLDNHLEASNSVTNSLPLLDDICSKFTHGLIATALCLSRSISLPCITFDTHNKEKYTKKSVMIYIRQHSSISLVFPELSDNNNSCQTVDFLIQSSTTTSSSSSSSSNNINTYENLSHSYHNKYNNNSKRIPSNNVAESITGNTTNVVYIDYNGVNSEGSLDQQIAEIRQSQPINTHNTVDNNSSLHHKSTKLSEKANTSTPRYNSAASLEIETISPGKLLLEVSTGPKGLTLKRNQNRTSPQTVVFYEYEIMLVILPIVTTKAHKTIDTLEIISYVEESHRLNNLSLLFGSRLLNGTSGAHLQQNIINSNNNNNNNNNINPSSTTAGEVSFSQIGKIWKNFISNSS